jgi:hypothetical protein
MRSSQEPARSAALIPAIDRIQELLTSAAAPGTFATRQLADAGDLRLDVTGVGPVPLPLSPLIARKICKVVLTKTNALFTRDATERAGWTRDLAWLRRTAKTFARAPKALDASSIERMIDHVLG